MTDHIRHRRQSPFSVKRGRIGTACKVETHHVIRKSKKRLDKKGFLDHVIELADSSNGRRGGGGAWRRTWNDREDDVIFKGDRRLFLTEGTAKIDNHKYKENSS